MTKAFFKNLSKEEQRALTLKHGTKKPYFICPFCTISRPIYRKKAAEEKGKDPIIRFDKFDVDGWELIQTRASGGQGSGFWKVENECYNLHQVKKMPEYAELLEQIKQQAKRILEVLE